MSAFPIQLNDRWRIIDEDGQWIVQQRRGQPSKKSTGWRNRKFNKTRDGLELSLRQLKITDISEEVRTEIAALPEHYNDLKQQDTEGVISNDQHGKKNPILFFIRGAGPAPQRILSNSSRGKKTLRRRLAA